MVRDDTLVTPAEATEEDLLVVHTKRYLSSLKVRECWSLPLECCLRTTVTENTKHWQLPIAEILAHTVVSLFWLT